MVISKNICTFASLLNNKKNMTANEIRDSFKKFFESKQHAIVPSSPRVIKDDPTLMFTNAGMNH